MRILGIDIGGTNIKSGIVDGGIVTETLEIPTEAWLGGETVINKVFSLIDQYSGIDRIGISSAGQIDPVKGQVIYATDNIPGWTGMQIRERIKEKYSIKTCVENDVNAAALGEAFYGAAVGRKHFLCLTYGTGIGGAIVEEGGIYHGSSFSAAEFGHIITHAGGRECTCGHRGCYEAYASTRALIRSAKEVLGNTVELNGRTLMQLGQKDENIVKRIIHPWLDEVIYGLVSLVYIFNPELVVLGGGIMEQPYMIHYINKNLRNYIMSSFSAFDVVPARLGNNAGIIGASALAQRI